MCGSRSASRARRRQRPPRADTKIFERSLRPRSRPHPSPSPDRVRAAGSSPGAGRTFLFPRYPHGHWVFRYGSLRLDAEQNTKATFRRVENAWNTVPVCSAPAIQSALIQHRGYWTERTRPHPLALERTSGREAERSYAMPCCHAALRSLRSSNRRGLFQLLCRGSRNQRLHGDADARKSPFSPSLAQPEAYRSPMARRDAEAKPVRRLQHRHCLRARRRNRHRR